MANQTADNNPSNSSSTMPSGKPRESTTNIVIAALGGEGGGTLASWIEGVAQSAGWHAQTTSIAGVAQRTGATIYYVELFPKGDDPNKVPVLSIFPAPGDIDIAISSVISEAGRLIQRGFCTKDRTTLIASSHHVYGITEKITLGDGTADIEQISEVAKQQCKKLVTFDMRESAEHHNTVISASLLGALAGAKALPFDKKAFQAIIEQSGKTVENNLGAFNDSYNKAIAPPLSVAVVKTNVQVQKAETEIETNTTFQLPAPTTPNGEKLLGQIAEAFPAQCHEYLYRGVAKLLDYQDFDYAQQYLDEVKTILELEEKSGNRTDYPLSNETARYLALWMSFEDTARVAQIKTRESRQDKIRGEVKGEDEQILHVTEFFAPRLEELVQPLPAGIATAILNSGLCRKLAGVFTSGKKFRTDTILMFSVLRMMAFTRRWRRKTYTYAHEHRQIEQWLGQIRRYAETDQQAALELVKCARIVKGYGKTRERGSGQIEVILNACAANQLSAQAIVEWRGAALSDDAGVGFEAVKQLSLP